MSVVISAEGLGKKYLIGPQRKERYTALRDILASGAKQLGQAVLRPMHGRRRDKKGGAKEEFWALRDVSFEIHEGERIGIIGRNGAGKSTLLKILSRITEPSAGWVRVKGRPASLLEVGTGFHPELTGRENIYLNGAILGMTNAQIRRNFDEIVAFADVEKFLDTPVKRYSSGMYVRLAFAVAAHLEPEILIVDEVLAVGDAQFQRKCLGKMENVAKEGRTVVFVSHNMNAIEQLCTRALQFDNGRLKISDDNVREVIKTYLIGVGGCERPNAWVNPGNEFENPWFKPIRFCLTDSLGVSLVMPSANDSEMWVHIEGEVNVEDPALQLGYAIYSEEGQLLYWTCHTDVPERNWPKLKKGRHTIRSKIPSRFLNEGTYRLELLVALYFRQWLNEPGVNSPSIFLEIQGGLSESPYWVTRRPGVLGPVIQWQK